MSQKNIHKYYNAILPIPELTYFLTQKAICLAPTRELARQTSEVVKLMGKFTGIESLLVVADTEGGTFLPIYQ